MHQILVHCIRLVLVKSGKTAVGNSKAQVERLRFFRGDEPKMPAANEIAEREFAPTLGDELRQHAGKWVAMTREHVIADGDSPGEALARARDAGVERPMLTYVPIEDFFAYVL